MPAIDQHDWKFESLNAPADNAEAVTPHDTNTLAYVSRALWVGGAGNITVVMKDGTTILFSGVPAGAWMPIRVSQVRATGTTATNIVAVS